MVTLNYRPESRVKFRQATSGGRRRPKLKEVEIIEALRRENEEFRRLEQEHRNLDNTIKELESKKFLTADDELEIHNLKKLKLSKKDRMLELIQEYKKSHSLN